jgi:hypothetical protein
MIGRNQAGEATMDSAARIRQRILALFLPITAVLYVSCEALDPKGTDVPILTMGTALKLLPIAARHPGQLYLSGSLSLLALGALSISWAVIATLVRGRGAAMATVAALLGGIGAFCGALVNVLVGVNLAAAATAPISRAAAGQFLVTTFNSGFAHVFMNVYIAGIYLAPLLMGIAMWRSERVPRWLAVLFAAGLELAQQVPSAGPALVVVLMLPFAVAMVVLGTRVWQLAAGPAGDRDLLSDPVSQPAPAPVRAGADTVPEHAGTLAGPAARR